MKKIVVFVSIILLFTLCKHKENVNERKKYKFGSCQNEIIVHDKIPQIDNIDKFVDSIRYVRLETTPKSIIGDINGLEFVDNKIFILDGVSKSKSVLVFDNKGKFLNTIGEKGKGPNEYMSLSSFSVDHKNKLVILHDQGQRSFLFYDFSGDLKKRIKIDDLYLSYFKPFNDKILVFTNKLKFNDLFNDVLYLEDNKVIKGYLPFSSKIKPWFMPFNPFYEEGDNLYFIDSWNSQILELNEDSITVKYCFDFGDMQLPSEYVESLDLFLKHKEEYRYLDDRVLENSKFLFFSYYPGKSHRRNCLYRKNSGELFQLKEKNPINSKISLLGVPFYAKDNYFVKILESTMSKVLSDLPDNTKDSYLKHAVDGYNINENPILVITYMK